MNALLPTFRRPKQSRLFRLVDSDPVADAGFGAVGRAGPSHARHAAAELSHHHRQGGARAAASAGWVEALGDDAQDVYFKAAAHSIDQVYGDELAPLVMKDALSFYKVNAERL